MYLKELTLKGFKSFASATTMRFEPGITAVVGPNGSGKSNIVDALAWVMGEQGAKTLRGTSMEDVIFAGTTSRPPLGRAQVSLTIDNADGTLDIDYTEVTISRTIFRNGGSEYAINGSPCRLLDIQELLSDTGLGQQMHVIVGQGRLDAILRADPAGNRAFIEEAAGILKHRKRKERALRKLAGTETNLRRLDDLLGELRRQMGPLGRQARVSRRADAIQIELRDAQARLLADDAATLIAHRDAVRAELNAVRADLTGRQRELARVKVRIEQAEAASAQANPAIVALNQSWHAMSTTGERIGALADLADERRRSLLEQSVAYSGSDPDLLDRRAGELEGQIGLRRSQADDLKLTMEQATEGRADLERRLASLRQTITELRRTAQERDARIARLRELVAREEALATSNASRLQDFKSRRGQVAAQLDELRRQADAQRIAAGTADAQDLDAAVESAQTSLDEAKRALADLESQRKGVDSRRIALEAKADALRDALRHRSAAGALERDGALHPLGRLADAIVVDEGWEEAVAAALESFAGAIAVESLADVAAALDRAREDRLGKAALIVPDDLSDGASDVAPDGASGPGVADGVGESDGRVRPASALVHANPEMGAWAVGVARSVRALLHGIGFADDRTTATDALAGIKGESGAGDPDGRRDGGWRRVVTKDGEVVTPVGAYGGSSASPSDLSLASRRDRALAEAKDLEDELAGLDHRLAEARNAVDAAQAASTDARAQRAEQRVKAEQEAKDLKAKESRIADLERQAAQIDDTIGSLTGLIAGGDAKRKDLAEALEAARSQDGGADLDEFGERERELERGLGKAREAEVSAKMAWTEATRQVESLGRQARMLRDQAREARERKARIEELNAKRVRQAERIADVASLARSVAAVVDRCVSDVSRRRDEAQERMGAATAQLEELRAERDAIEPRVQGLVAREHELDVSRERLATEYGQLSQRVADELGSTLEEAVRDYGPDRPVPVIGDDGDDSAGDGAPRTVPYARAEQVKRLEKARRDLKALGKVNPLATEEFEALRARNQYLNDQRNDVAKSRDDLLAIIKDLDSTMQTVFLDAFHDTAEAFQQVFSTLFPGGKGRLRLEDEHDPLTTGVVVEASPAGKRVKRLSLLSGGERSLTALALLLAIFTARPSPFYVMDEVEAALDDINLTRLLTALERLREHAQLIIITHQQRTMAIADALYGVTMRADGVTAVISQRLERDSTPA